MTDSSKPTRFEILQKDLPVSLTETVGTQILSYSTVLIRLRKREHGPWLQQIGSGTFVATPNGYGILTANHVAEELEKGDRLGVMLGPEGKAHNFSFSFMELVVVKSGVAKIEEFGPDLAFIKIPPNRTGTVKMYKSFYNLETFRSEAVKPNLDWHEGLWVLCGTPNSESTSEQLKIGDFRQVETFYSYCWFSAPERYFERNNLDYFDVRASDHEKSDPTIDFGGSSGGGLWRVIIRKMNNDWVVDKYILTGVIFYQSEIEENHRFLRSHGPLSIYSFLS